MGKKYLRIASRGSCPREFLTIFGTTTKRDKMDDPTQGGWFGSGTKMAPAAALMLGMDVHISSHDAQGAYVLGYGVVDYEVPLLVFDPSGAKRVTRGPRIRVLTIQYGSGPTFSTNVSFDAFPNWSKPVGSDSVRSFRVLREYLRNALDADPEATINAVWGPDQAPAGWTYVFMPLTSEIRTMLRERSRYFKYLGSKPLCTVPGAGRVYPKSEAKTTRMFSLGTLAHCAAGHSNSSVFDYCLEDKSLLTEERVFSGTYGVQHALAQMLCRVTDERVLGAILDGALDGRATLETEAMARIHDDDEIPAADHWRDAWVRLNGSTAVISSDAYSDEYAAKTNGHKIVHGVPAAWVKFLGRCGVLRAKDVVFQGEPKEFVVVDKTPIEIALEMVIRQVFEPIWPELKRQIIYCFEPTRWTKQNPEGFTLKGPDGGFENIYVTRRRWNAIWSLGYVVQHELRHVRSAAADFTLEWQRAADDDVTCLAFTRAGIPDDRPEPDIEIAEDDTVPRT